MRPTENDPAHRELEPVPAGIPEGMKDEDTLLQLVLVLCGANITNWEWERVKRALLAAWPTAAAAADHGQTFDT